MQVDCIIAPEYVQKAAMSLLHQRFPRTDTEKNPGSTLPARGDAVFRRGVVSQPRQAPYLLALTTGQGASTSTWCSTASCHSSSVSRWLA